jgi:hypothetical protein
MRLKAGVHAEEKKTSLENSHPEVQKIIPLTTTNHPLPLVRVK